MEVVDGEAAGVGCVEGEDDFVDGDVEAIGRVGLRLGAGRECKEEENARAGAA